MDGEPTYGLRHSSRLCLHFTRVLCQPSGDIQNQRCSQKLSVSSELIRVHLIASCTCYYTSRCYDDALSNCIPACTATTHLNPFPHTKVKYEKEQGEKYVQGLGLARKKKAIDNVFAKKIRLHASLVPRPFLCVHARGKEGSGK